MTEVAGEVCDGFFCHAFTTEKYLREVTLPALERGRAKVGKTLDGFEIVGPSFVVTGNDEAEMAQAAAGTRQQIAFYGSTPAYRPVLEVHGWGGVQDRLNALSKQGEWAAMGELIDDEILNAFAVVAEPEQVAPELLRRYGDVIERISFYAPYRQRPRSLDEDPRALKLQVGASAASQPATSVGGARGAEQPSPDVLAEVVVGVAALLQHDGGQAEPGDHRPARLEAVGREREVAHRVEVVGVEPERHDEQRRPELDDVLARRGERDEVVVVVHRGREREVRRGAAPPSGAGLVDVTRHVRIGADRIGVQRDELDVVALVEDLLGAVAVVVVDVEHGHLRPRRASRGGGPRSPRC